MAAFGVAIGITASFAITRLRSSPLFGIRATDALTFVAPAARLSLASSWRRTFLHGGRCVWIRWLRYEYP
jgi:hypothetical protein